MGLIVKTNNTGSATRRWSAMIGGTIANPVAPTVTTLCAGFTQNFVVDRIGRFFYFVDGGGNLNMWDAENPGTAPSVIVTSGTLGTTIGPMDVTLDGSAIIACSAANKLLKILTASPYTVSVIAGSGADATTDGTGAAAAFNSPMNGVVVDPNNGLDAYVFCDINHGPVRIVTLSTGVVTTTYAMWSDSSYAAGYAMSANGTPFACTPYLVTSGNLYGTPEPGPAGVGTWNGGIAVDDAKPVWGNCYYFCGTVGGGASLVRANSATGTTSEIATLPSAVVGDGAAFVPAYFRNPAYYCVTQDGHLCKVSN